MMPLTTLEQQLSLLEAQLKAVSGAVIAADPQDLHSTSATLQQLAVEFLQLHNGYGANRLDAPHLTLRLQALGQGMSMVRESLLRRSAYVERALAVLAPQAQATYADNSGPYGGVARTAGNFKAFSA